MSFSARKVSWRCAVLDLGTRFTLSPSVHELASAPADLPRLLIFGFLLVLFFPCTSYAQLDIDTRIGFHGVFHLGRPFPLQIGLSNSGRPAEGNLDVVVWKGGATKGGKPFPLRYRREVFLSPQSRKSIQLTIDPDFISRPVTVSFSSPAGNVSRELDLRRYFSPAPLMLLVAEGSSIPPLSFGSSSAHRLVTVSLSELPADARALLGVSHLVLYDVSLRELSRAQLLALDTWLSAGGRMLILGSFNHALYQEPAISRYLPVRVTGSKRISFVPRFDGRAAPAIADVWAQSSTVLGGEVVLQADGIPVVVENSRGKGRITYLSLDIGRPPLSRWERLPQFLQQLVRVDDSGDAAPRTRWDESIFSQLIRSPSFITTYVPTGLLFMAIVGYLLGIGTLAWLWQSKRLASRPVLIGVVAFIAASSLAGYMLFSYGGNTFDAVLFSSTVLESVSDGYAEAQSNVAVFSTQLRQYELRLGRGWIDMVPVASSAKDRQEAPIITQDGGGASRYSLPLREWDYRLFRMRSIDRFPFRAEFQLQGEQLLMKLNNQTAKDLIDCWLVIPGKQFALGSIPPGASWTRIFSMQQTTGPDDRGSGRLDAINFRDVSFTDKIREILFHSSFFPRDGDAMRWQTGVAIFFGWVKEPQSRVGIDDVHVAKQDFTLFRAVFPLSQPEDE